MHGERRLLQQRARAADARRPPASSQRPKRCRTRLVPIRPLHRRLLSPNALRPWSKGPSRYGANEARARLPRRTASQPCSRDGRSHSPCVRALPCAAGIGRREPEAARPPWRRGSHTQVEEATPGFTPPPAPTVHPAPPYWQDTCPPLPARCPTRGS